MSNLAEKIMQNKNETFFEGHLKDTDPEIYKAIEGELGRQQNQIELIASENITSRSVIEAQGTVFTNKYAEGYPKKRYYGGCEFADQVEQLAIDRACELFDCTYANIQPNSGSQANQGCVFGIIKSWRYNLRFITGFRWSLDSWCCT